MKYFKNADNQIYAYEADGSQDEYIRDDVTPITEAEADAIRAEKIAPFIVEMQAKEETKKSALNKLAALGLTENEIKALLG